jgi:hypothetical protein
MLLCRWSESHTEIKIAECCHCNDYAVRTMYMSLYIRQVYFKKTNVFSLKL